MIEIINHGIYTSIQDMGRHDFQAFGVPISGALDQQAFCMANRIFINQPTRRNTSSSSIPCHLGQCYLQRGHEYHWNRWSKIEGEIWTWLQL